MKTQFGSKIKELREAKQLFLRHIAAQLDMDTAQLSKIENGSRVLKKEQIHVLADLLDADKTELETLWLADQLMTLVMGEPTASEALKSVSIKIKNLK